MFSERRFRFDHSFGARNNKLMEGAGSRSRSLLKSLAARRRTWPGERASGMILPVQGFERMDGELLDGAVGQLVPAGSMFAFLAGYRG
jgi:hypothetical protein